MVGSDDGCVAISAATKCKRPIPTTSRGLLREATSGRWRWDDFTPLSYCATMLFASEHLSMLDIL
jgi:hypothetical protein